MKPKFRRLKKVAKGLFSRKGPKKVERPLDNARLSLRMIYGEAKPKVRKVGSGVFAIGRASKSSHHGSSSYFVVSKMDLNQSYRPFMEMEIVHDGERISMRNARTLMGKPGTEVVRLFLNKAIALAGEKKAEEIEVLVDNKERKGTFEEMGFKFQGNQGILNLKKV